MLATLARLLSRDVVGGATNLAFQDWTTANICRTDMPLEPFQGGADDGLASAAAYDGGGEAESDVYS